MHRYETRDSIVLENKGQKIFGVFHRPIVPENQKCPVVLMCHGLGGHKVGRYRMYVILSEQLSKRGIASLRIDFRGSGDSEGDFSEMTLSGEVSDALKGVDYLLHTPHLGIDTSRMGIFGRSVGGTVAMMTAEKARKFKSIAIWAALFDGHQWLDKWNMLHSGELSDEHKLELMRINGQVPGFDFFKELFAIDMIDHLKPLSKTPFLNIHGEKDEIVAVQHSYHYENARKSAEANSQFIRLPQSDHDFSYVVEQEQAIKETSEWFEQTL